MSRFKILIPLLLPAAFAACDRMMDADIPVLEVSVPRSTFAAGEPVTFHFSGEADIISFWSGETGHRYEYKDVGEVVELSAVQLSFSTLVSNLSGGKKFDRRVLMSTDFDGDKANPYDLLDASWIDITYRFQFATEYSETPSGTADLTGYLKDSHPITFAFVYKCYPFDFEGNSPTLQIKNLIIRGCGPGGYEPIGDVSTTWLSAGFEITDFSAGTPYEGISEVRPTHIVMAGAAGPVDKGNEIWAVSSPVNPFIFERQPEVPEAVKAYSDEMPREYVHTYDDPGEYTVVFTAKNATAADEEETLCKINITITE